MKQVLVVGSLGFVGFAVTEKLLSEGYGVIGIDSIAHDHSFQRLKKFEIERNANFKLIEKELNAVNSSEILDTLDHVIYCLPPKRMNKGELIKESDSNIKKALQLCKEKEATILYASSLDVFEGSNLSIIDENTETCPISRHGWGTLKEEQLLLMEAKKENVPYVIIRFPFLYGPWQPMHMIYQKMLRKERVEINGGEHKDCLFIEDAVNGLLKVINKKIMNDILHFCSGKEGEWVRGVKLIGEDTFKIENSKSNSTLYLNLKATEVIGFSVETSLEQGIEKQKSQLAYIEKLIELGIHDID